MSENKDLISRSNGGITLRSFIFGIHFLLLIIILTFIFKVSFSERKSMAHTILYIATSKDGFIADKEGGVDWLPQEAPEGEDLGFEKFVSSIDIIAQGSRTFLQTIGFIESGIVPDLPYGGKHYVCFYS